MASIKDAVEETITDSNAILKIVFYTLPLYICAQSVISGVKPNSGLLLIGILFSSILLFGFMLKCTMNVASEDSTVLPSFNILQVFFIGLKGAIVLLPIALLSKIFGTLCVGFLANAPLPPNLILIFSWIIWIIFASFVYTGYLLYTRRAKVFDAYNISAISKYCIDIFLGVVFMKFLIAIIDLILIAPVGYFIWLFLGFDNPISIFFLCAVAVFNIGLMGHYMAQMAYEIIAIDEEEKAEDAELARLEKERLEKIKNNNL